MRNLLLAALGAGLVAGAGCTLLRPVKGPYVPHPGQKAWVDETAVINLVTRYVYDAHFDSRQPVAQARYAELIRRCYTQASSGGRDQDGGQRVVNFIHKIHVDAGGKRELWRDVLALARQGEPREGSLPVPAGIE
jgi:hypothetical protein